MKTEISRLPIRLKLDPGRAGTRKLVVRYGEALVCVRYRYDPAARRRYKTAEIVVDEVAWWPGKHRLKPNTLVKVRTLPDEYNLHAKLQEGGARWDGRRRLWWIKYLDVCKLHLEDRIIIESQRSIHP